MCMMQQRRSSEAYIGCDKALPPTPPPPPPLPLYKEPWPPHHGHGRQNRISRWLKCCIFFVFLGIAAVSVVLPQVLVTRQQDPSLHQEPAVDLTIVPDARLSRSFYGIDYRPEASLAQVVEDLKVLSQLTSRVRVRVDPRAKTLLKAIHLLNTTQQQMGVMLALDAAGDTRQNQYDALWDVLNEYGTEHVIGVSMPTTTTTTTASTRHDDDGMAADMRQAQEQLASHGYSSIPVMPTVMTIQHLLTQSHPDGGHNSSHAFFSGIRAEEAANWTWSMLDHSSSRSKQQKQQQQQRVSVLQEIGWPTATDGDEVQAVRDAVPSLANQQVLLDTFICQANARGVPYYWFEFKDQPRQRGLLTKVPGSSWGLVDHERALKHRRMPTCHVGAWQQQQQQQQ